MMKLVVNTTPYADGRILQEVCVEMESSTQELARFVTDTKEKQIRKALIELGWKPPICSDHCSIGRGSACCEGCEYYKD